jgi:hypothetical protein
MAGWSSCLFAQRPGSLPLTVAGGEGRIVWVQVIASPADDWINDLVPLRNGNVAAVGFVNRQDNAVNGDWQAVSVELSTSGARIAEHRYGEKGGTDAFWSMAEGADRQRIFAGMTTRIGPAGINGYVLVSRPDGSIVKENGIGHEGYDRFTDVVATAGGFIFVGHSQPPNGRRQTYLVKTDAAGIPLWERIYGGPETWSALYIEPSGDGGFVISGGTDGGGDGDMFILKVDADGRELWRKRIGTPDWDEINHAVIVRPDGTIVLTGYTNRHGEDSHDWVAATVTAQGELVRLERFGGPGDDRSISAELAADGIVWIVGHTESAGAGGTDLMVASLDSLGAFTGTAATIGGLLDDHGTSILPLTGGDLLIAGYSRNLGQPGATC